MKKNKNYFERNNCIMKIRSKYILKEIFSYIKIYVCLELIKYNKNLQNRLKKTILDYKNYSIIIIDIFPKQGAFGKFINIDLSKLKDFIAIYFIKKEGNEKIERNFIKKDETINHITIILNTKGIKSLKGLFSRCDSILEIKFTYFLAGNIKYMDYMFAECSNLTKIDFKEFDTSSVLSMDYMFYKCSNLEEL